MFLCIFLHFIVKCLSILKPSKRYVYYKDTKVSHLMYKILSVTSVTIFSCTFEAIYSTLIFLI